MADKYCAPCVQLQEESADFYENGVTEAVCESLENNTGFNPDSGNTDCDDLKTANDCLILESIESLPSYSVCDWKAFMEQYLPNQYNMNEAIICALCGVWKEVKNQRLNNLAIETRYVVITATPEYSIAIDRQGNFTYKLTDWNSTSYTEGTRYGTGTLKGKANFCFSIDENNTVSWNISSIFVDTFDYTFYQANPNGTSPTYTFRIPDINGTTVFSITPTSTQSVSINKTVDVNMSGTIATGATSDWITFMNVYNDWTIDDNVDLQVRFINNNVDAVPIC